MIAEQTMEDLIRKVRNTYFLECKLFRVRTRGENRGYRPSDKTIAKWDGGCDHRGMVHQSAWCRLIQTAMMHKVDPVTMVRAGFVNWPGNTPPLPNMLQTLETINKARAFASEEKEHYRYLLAAVGREAKQAMMIKRNAYPQASDSELWREVITSPTLSGGPLFRYSLAVNVGQIDLAQSYQHQAMLEYIQSPEAYDEVLGKHLPAAFREEASRLRQKFVQGG